jgi:phosphoribosylaminoimidazole (AIR) synthetase
MYRVFNMGLGFVAVVAAGDADAAVRVFAEHGHAARVIGRAVDGKEPFVRLTQPRLLGDGASFATY